MKWNSDCGADLITNISVDALMCLNGREIPAAGSTSGGGYSAVHILLATKRRDDEREEEGEQMKRQFVFSDTDDEADSSSLF